MKKFGWLLLLVSLNAFAQPDEVIMGTPLSVEEEAGRQIIVRPTGALVPAEAVINPEDGQLKLGPSTSTKREEVSVEVPITAGEAEVDDRQEIKSETYQKYLKSEKFLQFSFGYVNSKYEKVDSTLDDGSTLTSFRFVSDMNSRFQTGFAMEVVSDNSGQSLPDSIRVLQYKLFIDYHAPIFVSKVDYLFGLSLSMGDYSIRRLNLNAQREEVNTKIKSGTIFGLAPAAGVRIYLVDRNSIDIVVEYHQYFSKPQSYIGGFAFVPRFSFLF